MSGRMKNGFVSIAWGLAFVAGVALQNRPGGYISGAVAIFGGVLVAAGGLRILVAIFSQPGPPPAAPPAVPARYRPRRNQPRAEQDVVFTRPPAPTPKTRP